MAGTLLRVTDFVPATPILSAEVDAEFNQLVNLLNGTTNNVKATIEVSDTGDPPLELNQTSTGPLLEMFQAGILKAHFRNDGALNTPAIRDANDNEQLIFTPVASAVNEWTVRNAATGNRPALLLSGGNTDIGADVVLKGDGQLFIVGTQPVRLPAVSPSNDSDAARKKYVDDKRTYFVIPFKIDDPSTFPTSDLSALPFVRIPAIDSGFITRIHILFASGSHTAGAGNVVTFKVVINGSAVGSGASFNDTNNTSFVFYAEDFADQAISDGSSITVIISARTGTITERNVTVNVEGYQKIKAL